MSNETSAVNTTIPPSIMGTTSSSHDENQSGAQSIDESSGPRYELINLGLGLHLPSFFSTLLLVAMLFLILTCLCRCGMKNYKSFLQARNERNLSRRLRAQRNLEAANLLGQPLVPTPQSAPPPVQMTALSSVPSTFQALRGPESA